MKLIWTPWALQIRNLTGTNNVSSKTEIKTEKNQDCLKKEYINVAKTFAFNH